MQFYFILILSLIIPIILQRKRYRKLYHHHKTLVQEKEAALGFVQNVGSIFEDAESVEMNQLLERASLCSQNMQSRLWCYLFT